MLSNIEWQLLHHYSERERVIDGPERSLQHQRLLALGYIREQKINLSIPGRLIVVTPAGRAALGDGPSVA
jgi:hypothetical protein